MTTKPLTTLLLIQNLIWSLTSRWVGRPGAWDEEGEAGGTNRKKNSEYRKLLWVTFKVVTFMTTCYKMGWEEEQSNTKFLQTASYNMQNYRKEKWEKMVQMDLQVENVPVFPIDWDYITVHSGQPDIVFGSCCNYVTSDHLLAKICQSPGYQGQLHHIQCLVKAHSIYLSCSTKASTNACLLSVIRLRELTMTAEARFAPQAALSQETQGALAGSCMLNDQRIWSSPVAWICVFVFVCTECASVANISVWGCLP